MDYFRTSRFHSEPTCFSQWTAIQTVDNSTCADLVHSEPQTTLPAPTTTLSSSSYCKIPDSSVASEDAKTGSMAVFIDLSSANVTSGT